MISASFIASFEAVGESDLILSFPFSRSLLIQWDNGDNGKVVAAQRFGACTSYDKRLT